jgi:hypothetical protein
LPNPKVEAGSCGGDSIFLGPIATFFIVVLPKVEPQR